MTTIASYLSTLFDDDENVCAAENAFCTKLQSVKSISSLKVPPEFVALNPMTGSRRDANVTVFRNILIEIDTLPLQEQCRYINDLGMPYSTAVFSGNKSFHFVISLDNPLTSREEYDRIVRWLHGIVDKADRSAKNPSRFTRFPGTRRRDTGKTQDLTEIKGRTSTYAFFQWLEAYAYAKPETNVKRAPSSILLPEGKFGRLSAMTCDVILNGAERGERNSRYFLAACDFREQGYPEEYALDVLASSAPLSPDFPLSELERTIASAYSRPSLNPPRL